MNIAYLRQGMGIFLDQNYKGSSGGSWEERHAFFKGAEARGHNVYIYTHMVKNQESFLENYPNVTYCPNQSYISKDTDFMYIEGGPDNYMYKNPWKVVPNLVLLHALLGTYQGLVFFSLSDGRLAPSLIPEAYSVNQSYQFLDIASTSHVFEDKGWVLLGKGYRDNEFLRKYMSGKRCPIDLLTEIPIDYWEPGAYLEDQRKPVKKDPQYDLTYTGNSRGRMKMFTDWYGGYKNINVNIFGNWKHEVDLLQKQGMIYHGSVSNAKATEILNDSIAQIYITDNSYYQSGMIASRMYEVIGSGCTLWIPRELRDLFTRFSSLADSKDETNLFIHERAEAAGFVQSVPMDEFVVEDRKCAEEVIEFIKGKSEYETRKSINDEQIDIIKHLTPELRMKQLEEIVKNRKDLSNTQYNEMKPKLYEHIQSLVTATPTDTEKRKEAARKRMSIMSEHYNFDGLYGWSSIAILATEQDKQNFSIFDEGEE